MREVKKSREKNYEGKDNDLVEIDPIKFGKIKECVCLKSKCLLRRFVHYLLKIIAHKGIVAYLLKKLVILSRERTKTKEYTPTM